MIKLGLSILINNACNLNCKYCYEKNNGTEFLTKDNLDSIISRFEKSDFFNGDIEFFGGEPSMSLENIKYVIEKYPKNYYRMITNGFFFNYPESFYDVLSKLNSVVISVELTEESFREYRHSEDLDSFLNKIINISKKWNNVSVNVSINDLLVKNTKEFIDNVNKLKDNNIPIHFYSLKYNSSLSEMDYYKFLMDIKNTDLDIYNQIILKNNKESDTNFTCTFENRIYVNSDMRIVNCAWMKDENSSLTLDSSDKDIYDNYIYSIAKNHKDNFNGCKDCCVEIGKCSISCRSFFKSIEKENNFELLEKLCNFEKIKECLRHE